MTDIKPQFVLSVILIGVCVIWMIMLFGKQIPQVPFPVPLDTSPMDPHPNGRCLSCFKWKFPLSISPHKDLCYLPNQQKIDLIVVVPTKHENIGHRNLFREMFNSSQFQPHNIMILFAFGKHPDSIPDMEKGLYLEAQLHGDILQTDVNGTYRNSTLLAYNAFNWVTKYCPNARFLLKTTDDVIFNVLGILNLLDAKGDTELSDVVFGSCGEHANVIRTKPHKWYMSKTDYPFKHYPAYCMGAGFFFSLRLLQDFLLKEAENMAFPTGIDDLTVGINLRLTGHCVCHIPYFNFMGSNLNLMELAKASSPTNCTGFRNAGPFLGVHLHGQSIDNIRMFWTKRHCYEPLVPSNKAFSAIECKRHGQCPQDHYHIKNMGRH